MRRSLLSLMSLSAAAAVPVTTTASVSSMRLVSSSSLTPMRTPALALQQQQRYASFAPLADVVQRELDEETNRSGKPEEPQAPKGWTVQRKPGSFHFSLTRTFEDEHLTVRYTPTENTDVNYHEVLLFVTKGNAAGEGPTLEVNLSVEEGEIVLDGIAYFQNGKLAVDTSAEGERQRAELYPGPNVSELDETMVDSFIDYLEKRGVNQELAEFVSLYSFWAEQKEYEGWLQNMHQFVK